MGLGDIGTDPVDVEINLEKHFNLAHKWGCVLLLDEADVFLAERQVGIPQARRPSSEITNRSLSS